MDVVENGGCVMAGRPISDLTSEALADLRVSVQATMDLTRCERVIVPGALMFALLDAAAERGRLVGLLDEPRRSGCAVEIAGVRIAPCDERGQTADMRALDSLSAEV